MRATRGASLLQELTSVGRRVKPVIGVEKRGTAADDLETVAFRRIGAGQLFTYTNGVAAPAGEIDADPFAGRVVIVGASYSDSGDVYETPLGTMPGALVLANSTAYDQQNNPGPELTDVLPSQLTLVSASATAGTAVATVGTLIVGAKPPGSKARKLS